jgi:hypothetical protein
VAAGNTMCPDGHNGRMLRVISLPGIKCPLSFQDGTRQISAACLSGASEILNALPVKDVKDPVFRRRQPRFPPSFSFLITPEVDNKTKRSVTRVSQFPKLIIPHASYF